MASLRPRAFAIAYRMLGSVAEAEDIVQEALLRVHRTLEAGERIDSPPAYIATVTTRLAIDHLRSARVRREEYVGEWLPEPLVTDGSDDPAQRVETADALSMAFLVLLESLTPEQRAAFLLHDVFDYGYAEIAGIVGTSEVNARQLAARARRHVAERRPRFRPTREQHARLARTFFDALQRGDLRLLEAQLSEDVVLYGDGGGKVPALATSVRGAARIARTLVAWARLGMRGRTTVRQVAVNGEPGALILDADGRLLSVMGLEIVGGRIVAVHSIVNPDKLRHLGIIGDMRTLLARH